MLKRIFDIVFSGIGIIILSPFFIIISLIIPIESRGGAFFLQTRVGRNNKDFKIFKFRSMKINSDKKGLLTTSSRDTRITRVGYYLRKFKLDELPQLFNVFFGDMSIVGPRPEVRKYVDLYNEDQKRIFLVKPGITDLASITYFDENKILENSAEPEKEYINSIMPHKLELNLLYLENRSIFADFKIILKTIKKIFS